MTKATVSAAQVKSIRLEAGDTPKEAAKRVHISERAWYFYEEGLRYMPLDRYENYCKLTARIRAKNKGE